MNKSRGRRQGKPETKQAILEIARRRFLEDGYAGVSLRSVATEADVDAALISYFFRSKSGLFGAAMSLQANPAQVFAKAIEGPQETLGFRLVSAMVHTWDDPESGPALQLMVRAASQDEEVARGLREMLGLELVHKLAERLGGTDATARAGALVTILAGVISGRYVLRIEPITSMPADELVRHVAPAAQAAVAPTPWRPPRR